MAEGRIEQSRTEIDRILRSHTLGNPGSLAQALEAIKKMVGTTWVLMTPDEAKRSLDKYNKHNRDPKPTTVAAYTSDMRHRRWLFTPEPLIYLLNGELANGQHRMLAVIESGCAVFMPVVRGAPNNIMRVIDTGTPRSTPDVAKIIGEGWVDNFVAAIAQQMIYSYRHSLSHKPSNQEKLAFMSTHKEALLFAACDRQKMYSQAAWLAVLGRAWYTVDHPRLERFKTIITLEGSEKQAEKAANSFRDFVAINYLRLYGQAGKGMMYRLCELCLRSFLKGEAVYIKNPKDARHRPLRIITGSDERLQLEAEEFYKLPEEEELNSDFAPQEKPPPEQQ